MVVRIDRHAYVVVFVDVPIVLRIFSTLSFQQVFRFRLAQVQHALHVLQGDGLVGVPHEFQHVLPGPFHERWVGGFGSATCFVSHACPVGV
eukprot:scaffold1982_cov358-Pavlova_lutheri.AAC.16